MFPPHLSCRFLALVLTLSCSLPNIWAAQREPGVLLQLGKPIERQLGKDETHSYTLNLPANQYAYVVVDQRGIDVAVAFYGPDGAKIVEVDSPNESYGPEPVSFVADTAGTYRLEVRSTVDRKATGRYELRLELLRSATQEDRSCYAAQKLSIEAKKLRNKRKTESYQQAIEKYQAALNMWRALDDKLRQAFTLHEVAWIYGDTGQYQKALDCYAQANTLYRALGDRRGEASIISNTAWIFGALGENQKALEMYLQVEEAYRTIDKVSSILISNIGAAYAKVGQRVCVTKLQARTCAPRISLQYRSIASFIPISCSVCKNRVRRKNSFVRHLTPPKPDALARCWNH